MPAFAVPLKLEGKPVLYNLCLTGTIESLIYGPRDSFIVQLRRRAARLALLLAARLP